MNTDSPRLVLPVLKKLVGKGSVKEIDKGVFAIEAEMDGDDPKELNRNFLSELRRAEKRTRLRSKWKVDEKTYRFFDYVLKGVESENEA